MATIPPIQWPIEPPTPTPPIIGPPTGGRWLAGVLFTDSKRAVFRCTATGTPGTWVQTQPAIVADTFTGAPDNYLVTVPGQGWKQYRYDLATTSWKPVFLTP